MECLDIVIIGAGWHGLAMGKTYLEVCPNVTLAIIDTASSIGGVWSKERLYPGLKTNNLLGSYEFSDFPMTFESCGVEMGEHIPGAVVHSYLTKFANHFGLTARTRLNHKAESAELLKDGSWLLRISHYGERSSEDTTLIARKLVIATGLTSTPFVPKFQGEAQFGRSLFHAKELKQYAGTLEAARSVAVLGGNKSAWDTCYLTAKAGSQVHMIIRPTGGGPSWVWPVLLLPFKLSIQRVAATRFFSWMDPCIWSKRTGFVGWIRYLLHRTLIGRAIVSGFWKLLGELAFRINRYDTSRELRKLKPWVGPFWMGNSLGIHNYESSFFDLVRENKIKIHIADIVSLNDGVVNLLNGDTLHVDALVCCTGWHSQPPIKFLPQGLMQELGLYATQSDEYDLAGKARFEILSNIPAMRGGPVRTIPFDPIPPKVDPMQREARSGSPYRLYRFMIPPNKRFISHRNIVFLGAQLAITATMIAQLQALWATAFFNHEIPHLDLPNLDLDHVRYQTVLHTEYSKMRHPPEAGGSGERYPDLTFDCLPYMDLLLDDLGIDKYRKGSVWSELFHRYGPRDFEGLIQEWLLNKALPARQI